jgi:hypothetical protein
VAEIESVSLRRGACYGPCPIYQVTLRRDGTATWHGDTFSQRLGDYRGEVFEEDFVKLAGFIEQSGFFEWADRYEVEVTDNPEYELEVERGDERRKVVQYATDEPRDFWTIATLIDGLCFGIEWVPQVNEVQPT